MALPYRRIGAAMRRLRQASAWLRESDQDRHFRHASLALVGASAAATLAFVPGLAHCYYETLPDGSADRLKRWTQRSWGIKIGSNPGFHLRTVNPWLERHLDRLTDGLALPEDAAPSVLVPLCGKSMDMPYLCEQGFAVLGVEGALRPIVEFRAEHRMRLKEFKKKIVMSFGRDGWAERVDFIPAAVFQGWKSGYVFKTDSEGLGYYADSPAVYRGKVRASGRRTLPLHLLHGDLFNVTPQLVKAATYEQRGAFDIVYDRGGLDSVPPDAREEYLAVLSRLLRPGGRFFLVTSDYDQTQVPVDPTGRRWSPPPFSVSEDEVRRLFPEKSWNIEVLGRQKDEDLSAGNPSFYGVSVFEAGYLITKRQPSSLFGSAGDGSVGPRRLVAGAAALATVGVGGATILSALRRRE